MKTEKAKVASQYARAVIQLAEKSGLEQTLLDNLRAIAKVAEASAELKVLLSHPSIPTAEKKKLLISLFGNKVNDLTLRLLELLCDRRRLDLIPFILTQYEELWREKNNIVLGTLSYAEKPDAPALAEIKAKLTERLGKKLELEEREDKSLIGGYVLRIGDKVIDGSLKGRLETIEKALLSV